MLLWIIFYSEHSERSTFSSDDGPWSAAPGWDVQVVLFRDPIVKWGIRLKKDYYRLADDGTVVGMDLPGLYDYLFTMNGAGCVKAGRMISQAHYKRVENRAKTERARLQAIEV